ncbi:small nuclear ribonucleoprotein B [Aaosphaeria arxii CBS 175.79]|uniref:Mitochondrial pyruvate carrier n=1 Tax=Aaosphaeria arxii CBS 175.79 TaxID=1450172 RepID=A0A6A5XTE0_9PLEO|nr:small nuclear ribonucleoprotein B [Aaosphaeria arxii CBS 175.79]KAF2015950.1 small nuclear ribonucleoprotein B [Aaosphaeria arxii CBS 175.79]
MAAAIKALNAKIRSNPYTDYFFSTHFWGPASNFGIPIAAVADMTKDPEIISGRMTGALALYSAVFMRYALAVSPKNYLLFGCHFINCASQLTQGYRYVQYFHMGGQEAALKAKELTGATQTKVLEAVEKAKDVVGKK